MEISLISGFWLVSFLLTMTPGADWAYTISAGIQGKRIHAAVMGLISGHLLITLVVVAGMGVLLTRYPGALSILTFIGACYLLWLGITILRNPASLGTAEQHGGSFRSWAVKGLCTSGLNPKVFLLFLALLPQFTDPKGTWPIAVQMSFLSMMHIVTCSAVYLLVGYSARALLTSRPKAAWWVSMTSGAVMIFVSVVLLYEQLHIHALYLGHLKNALIGVA